MCVRERKFVFSCVCVCVCVLVSVCVCVCVCVFVFWCVFMICRAFRLSTGLFRLFFTLGGGVGV